MKRGYDFVTDFDTWLDNFMSDPMNAAPPKEEIEGPDTMEYDFDNWNGEYILTMLKQRGPDYTPGQDYQNTCQKINKITNVNKSQLGVQANRDLKRDLNRYRAWERKLVSIWPDLKTTK